MGLGKNFIDLVGGPAAGYRTENKEWKNLINYVFTAIKKVRLDPINQSTQVSNLNSVLRPTLWMV